MKAPSPQKPHRGAPSTLADLNSTERPRITTVPYTLNLGALPHAPLDERLQQDFELGECPSLLQKDREALNENRYQVCILSQFATDTLPRASVPRRPLGR